MLQPNIADPAKLGGVQLALVLDKKRVLTIPIVADRLAAAQVKAAAGLSVRTPEVR